MGKNVGNNWTRKCFPKLVDNSIKKVKDKNHIETDENILYYADFIQLVFLLFLKYSNETISQSELIEKLKDEMFDIKELINKYEEKSNWDRYFQPLVNKENLENNLNKLYWYRNLVAHNRKIRKNDKDETKLLVTNIKEVLDNCLSKIDEINVPEEEKENLENMSCQIFNPLSYEIGNNSGFQSTIDYLKLNWGLNSEEYMSGVNSMNKYLETNSTLKSTIDFPIINLGVNDKGIVSAIDSKKINQKNQANTKKEDTKKDENKDNL